MSRLKLLDILVIVVSVALCSILMFLRLPGMELLGISPNWLLIWVVAWSSKRGIWQGAIAGVAMGCIYDSLTVASPSHILSLVIVGVLTSSLQKQKYIKEDFISIALIVFFMTIVAETVFALQYAWMRILPLTEVWHNYQQIAIASAILSSLWSPILCYPLALWWEKIFIQRELGIRS
ncbi:rod shape-determining protein MreD [Myxosarcina sp. GI1]|uniref:rod shape-determining protein MreD n=1 Tax=Myxosarcina sp. GI1 TaxID=1541065 RepID=UPI00056AD1EA|nr:rod shape-determining protein MreD [Myxosarcina sp. GI1]